MTEEVGEEKPDGKQNKGKQGAGEERVAAAGQPPGYRVYPKPIAAYENVASDRGLFLQTLEELHAAMGTKFMVPTVGGKELDLHQLFVEVTSRGGIEKVIRDRRWREVIAAFSFPSTATNASFVLRKYYMSLLYHYEQIYFFKSPGWKSPPAGTLRAPPTPSISSERLLEPTSEATQKRRRGNDVPTTTGPSLQVNSPVGGVIDGKFEHGYFITVTVGTTKLQGILYHVPEQADAEVTRTSIIPQNSSFRLCRHRRRKRLSKRDPTHPKPNRSGYNFFFAEQHARLKPLHPGKDREISKMIGDLWNNLTDTEKAVYQEKGVKDKERYRSEMQVYKQRLQMGQVISTAVPIQQRPAVPEMGIADRDTKMEIDEGDHDESASDGSNSEGKESDTDSEQEVSPEAGGGTRESVNLDRELLTERYAFQLRRRDDIELNNGHVLPCSNEDADSTRI